MLQRFDPKAALQSEAYRESAEERTLHFTERGGNALIAHNTDQAHRVAIDLSDDLISARILVPEDEDVPMLGGKTVRLKTGMKIAYHAGRPIAKLRGIIVMGVSLSNARLGGLKHVDLLREVDSQSGFWRGFAEGLFSIHLRD